MEITSINNEKVKAWKKLLQKKYRTSEKLFLIEGDHLVNIALDKNIVKEIITLDDKVYNVDTYKVNEKIMKELTNQVTAPNIIGVCNFLEEKDILDNIVILDNLQDPGNLGTIIRSAVAFNFDTVVLGNDCVDLYNPKVIRATEGMIFNINIIRKDLVEFIPSITDKYNVITTNVKSGNDIRNINKDKNIALVIGNEGNGVKEEISDLCNETVKINMNSSCESLNAGVCASILMYEVSHE